MEGARDEEGPDDSGTSPETFVPWHDNLEARQSHADYGDDAAHWGEQADNSAAVAIARKHQWREGLGFSSLVNVG